MRSFQIVENKIWESDFFLGKIKCSKGIELRYYLSAYLSSSRSITFALQKAMDGITFFDEWYKSQQEKLKNNTLAQYLVEARNCIIHEGYYPITPGAFYLDKYGTFCLDYVFNDIPLKNNLEIPDKKLIDSCKEYFISLLYVIRECFDQFGQIIDPVLHFDHVISSGKASLEDIEEELGFSRGWTNVAQISQRERAQMLRAEFEKDTTIDIIFIKYLRVNRLGISHNDLAILQVTPSLTAPFGKQPHTSTTKSNIWGIIH